MLKRGRTGRSDVTLLTQRVENCDKYHMAFDTLLREYYDSTAQELTGRTDAAIDTLLHSIDQAHRTALLRQLYNSLTPKAKLDVIARVTGDETLQHTLRELAEAEAAYDRAIMQVTAEASRFDRIHTAAIPADANVRIILIDQSRINDKSRKEIDEMTYDYSVELRAIGDGEFKIVDTIIAPAINTQTISTRYYKNNTVVRVGTTLQTGNKRTFEATCRFKECLALQPAEGIFVPQIIRKVSGEDDILYSLVIKRILLDGKRIIPQ